MMNAVNSGSVYTKNLFLYLHKTYYRKEYQMLKRFHTLSAPEVVSLRRNTEGVMNIQLGVSRNYMHYIVGLAN